MTTADARLEARPTVVESGGPRPSNVALFFAICGGWSMLMFVYVLVAWLTSGDVTRTPTGADPVPAATKVWIWCYQIAGIVLLVGFVVYIVRSWRRNSVVPVTGAVFIAWTINLWVDPATLNFFRPQMLYNSYAINFGSWGPQIPGWLSPNAQLLPAPLVAYSGMYGAQVLLAVLGFQTMRRVRRRRPEMSAAGVMLYTFGVLMVVDLVLEVILIRAELWAYAGVVQRLSIWGGERYQFPLYEPVFFGGINVVIAALFFFRDDNGRTFVERGAMACGPSGVVRSTMRILTVTGFVTLAYIAYSVAIGILSFYGGPYPEGYKSYMLNGMCGPGTQYECMGPHVPVPLPKSGPLPPG